MDQNDKKLGNSSTPADSGDLPSDEILPATTNVPPLQGTDSGTGTKSNSNGSDTKNEVEANREEKLVEKEAKSDCNGGPSVILRRGTGAMSSFSFDYCFLAEVTASNLQEDKLYLPVGATSSTALNKQCQETILVNKEGNSWNVSLRFTESGGKYYITRGWRKFCLDNNCEIGDLFVFNVVGDGKTTPLMCVCPERKECSEILSKYLSRKSGEGSSRTNVEDKRSPEDVLKEMQMQRLMISTVEELVNFEILLIKGESPHFLRTGTAHDLYCPNCTHNITRTAELFEKGKEKFQYNNENIILSFVIVVSFKYPFIFLPWFYNNTPDEPAPSVVSETPKKHVPAWLRFVLVVVLLLLSALVLLWIPPSPSPLSPSPIPPPTPHTNGSLTIDIPDPQKVPEDATEIDGNLIPHGPGVVEDDKPIWPSPSTIVNKGGLVHFYWVKYLPSSRVLYVISLLLLAVLALFWPSMTRTKGTEPEDEKEVLGDKEGVPSLIGGLSTPGNKTNGSERAKEIPPPHVAPQPTTFAKILSILRQHIVVPVHNVLQTELDILKSIVYGGLIESITSFGVVSSAAASGTSTLNVMALGLANLFSGLFLIIYNLYGLVMSEPFFPHAHIDNATDMKDKIDPYEQMLGNRNNVALHCIVVVVSFIFFGVIPPLFYGFSFKTTDNRYYEAAVFVAASLLCVITLSFGKAHAFKKDKLKTVAVYTGIAIGASAFSCIASQHVRGLLEKYEFHKIASD
ncbi:hypothetical protein YC2023_100198 [Brassica napus]